MSTQSTIRTASERRAESLEELQRGRHVWVASGNENGTAHLIALSYFWDGERLNVATRVGSKTARNLERTKWARMSLPSTENSVVLEGPVERIALDADAGLMAAHKAAAGFDVRELPEPYVFFRLTPVQVLAMRSPDEEPDRVIMRNGRWLDD